MSKFQLYINNQRVELFPDESVSLTETIQDIRDVSKVFTNFTKPFTLPASDTNNKIFKHYYRFNLVQGYTFDARKKIDARIELNTIPYRDGKIQLEGVDLEKGRPKLYRVTFFGNTVNLKDILGDDEINGLTWLSNFNTNYSPAEIAARIQDPLGYQHTVDGVQYDAALIVALISNKMRLYYDSSAAASIPYINADGTDNVDLGGNLYPHNAGGTLVTDDVHGVYYEDLSYSVKVHLIIKAIEDQYAIKFSDDFFHLTNGPDTYKNLYMLCQRKEGRLFEDVDLAEKLIDTFPTVANLNIAVSGARVRVFGLNPNQVVSGTWTIQTPQAYPTFTAHIREGSATVIKKTFNAGTNTTATVSQILTNSSTGYTLTIETNSAFGIDSITFNGTTPNGNQLTSQITSPNPPAINITIDKQFIVQNHLPNLKVIDFLTGLFKMFNLTAFERDGIIHVKTLESFYNGGTIRNITEFVDPKTISIDKALPYKEIEFKYKDTGATLAKQHEELQGVEWGAAKYVETGDLNSSSETFKVEAPFAHLKYERIINNANQTQTDIQWGFMADEKNEIYFEDAVLFVGEFVNLNSDIRLLTGKQGVSSILDIGEYWMPSNYVSRDATVSKEGIHFDLELSEWTSTADFTETLFNKYYRFYISGLFNSAKRLTRITARLPKKFVLNFTLADTVTINDDKYKINSITTNLLSGSSQLELLNETVNDAAVTQTDTGGTGGQTGVPLTNVLTLFQCASPNSTFESTATLSTLNLAINQRVVDSSGNTYRVTGDNVPNTHTSKAVTATGLTGCPATPPPPPTYYYGLQRCSDGATNLRTHSAVGSPTYASFQQVFDASNIKYVIANSNTLDSVPSITIASSPSPAQISCSGNATTNYYALNPCCSGTILYGFSASSSKSGTYVYNNQTYVIAPSNNSGTINIDNLATGSCTTYYYSLNSCTDGSIQHYGTSNCSNLNGTQLTYNGTCYQAQNTTNTSGSINLDTLSSCSCTVLPVYYLLRDCQTASIVRTATTTQDIPNLTVSTTPSNASLVQDNSTGKCYTVNATTTDTATYQNPIGQVTNLSSLGCPATPCGTVQYYQLQQCSTGSTSYITGQTTTQISLSTGDFVHSGSTSGPLYKVLGTTTSGSTVGTVVTSTETACPTFYELKQCYTLQTGYRSGNSVSQISLSVGDRVQDSCGMPYTVTTVGVSGGGYANVGTVTDTGQTNCPTITGSTQYWALQRCSDSTTGYLSLQTVNDVSFNSNDTVTTGGARYQVVGAALINTGIQVGVVCADGGNNCISVPTPPVQPPATIYYARFISCDDPTGFIIDVYSYQQISTWWVIQEVGQFECYRWHSNHQGVNPTELNSSNFNIFSSEITAGANCLDCQATVPVTPPPPTPPAQTCFTVSLRKGAAPLDLCGGITRAVDLNASTLSSASVVYSDDTCSSLFATDQYFAEQTGNDYYFWNATSQTLSGPYTLNCP